MKWAFDLIWMQFDKTKQQEGKRLLEEAVAEGDPEAYCFLARTYMGFQYVWESDLKWLNDDIQSFLYTFFIFA